MKEEERKRKEEEEKKKREEEEMRKRKEEEERARQLEERLKREDLETLLTGLRISTKTKDVLVEHEILTAAALTTANCDDLKQLGIKTGQALEIKSRFHHGKEDEVNRRKEDEERRRKEEEGEKRRKEEEIMREKEERDWKKELVKDLFAGLSITPQSIDILVEHEILTAVALTMIGLEDLKHLGIKVGQALEIKNRFKEGATKGNAPHQTGGGAAVC